VVDEERMTGDKKVRRTKSLKGSTPWRSS